MTNQIKLPSNQTHVLDEEGLKRAYDSPNIYVCIYIYVYYQHRNNLFIAGTKDFPTNHLDTLTLRVGNNSRLTKRGNDVQAYYRNNMTEHYTVIGHSLGGSVALALEEK